MPANRDPPQVGRKAPYYWCRCPDCQCSATTQYETHICYSCRGGVGVALTPREPAHRPKPRTDMPKLEPIRVKEKRGSAT